MPVVVNNTPLVALWVLGRLDLLRQLFGEVLIPPAVQAEFLGTERIQRQQALDRATWIRMAPLLNPRHPLAYTGLDRGEAETLALAEECGGMVIMDERKGRRYAQRLALPLTGTLGVLLLAKEHGLITTVSSAMAQLQNAGLYLDAALVARVLDLAGESD
jgi:predicted nucleic acid-binding protein